MSNMHFQWTAILLVLCTISQLRCGDSHPVPGTGLILGKILHGVCRVDCGIDFPDSDDLAGKCADSCTALDMEDRKEFYDEVLNQIVGDLVTKVDDFDDSEAWERYIEAYLREQLRHHGFLVYEDEESLLGKRDGFDERSLGKIGALLDKYGRK